MKRKLLSLIIAFVLIGSGLVLAACGGSSDGYNLSNLITDYKTQIGEISNVNVLNDNTIEFDYSQYVYNGREYLLDVVNNYEPYKYLQTYYNEMLKNSMAFIYSYIGICSNNNIDAPAELKDEVKSNLDKLVFSLKKTGSNVEAVADKIRKDNPPMQAECLNSLKNLFDSYDELYQSAFNLSSTLSQIYFNNAYSNSNPDYSNTSVNDYDANNTVLLLNSRIKYQIANLTQSYVEINLKGSDLSKSFTTVGNIASIPYSYSTYTNKINDIDMIVDDTFGVTVNASDSKQEFLSSAIALYNCLSTLKNDYAIYHKACNDIVYSKVVRDANATRYEKTCAEIIKNHAYVVDEMNSVIANMLNILNSI